MLSIRPQSPSQAATPQSSASVRSLHPSSSLDDLLSPPVVHKRGYLWKQGGARGGRKSWKRRWFVLKEDCLYYYASEAEAAALLGVMPLHASQLLDVDGETAAAVQPRRADGKVCFECKRPFSLTLRRHHCRRCGRSFCDRCSSQQTQLSSLGHADKVRVCQLCYEEEAADRAKQQQAADELKTGEAGGGGGSRSRGGSVGGREEEEKVERDSVLSAERRSIRSFTLPAVSKPNQFALKTAERELWLQAESVQSRLEWLSCISAVQQQSAAVKRSRREEPQWEIDYSQITLLQRVAGGTFGDVYRARLWGTEIALKLLRQEEFATSESVLLELKKEVSILSQLRHPNVVLYLGACTVPPHVCIATEWCGRGSLHDVLHDHSIHVNAKLVVELAMGVAQGVNYLHSLEHRIIHRDLKSANILVNTNWQVKVADLGLSFQRAKDGERLRSPLASTRVAAARARGGTGGRAAAAVAPAAADDEFGIVGTPEYIAPEVMEGLPYSEKVDVYSFGILLCELVARQPPFHDRYAISCYLDVVEAVLDEAAIPTIPAWCSTLLTPLILRCLSRAPHERPSFTEIIFRLREVEGLDEAVYFTRWDLRRLQEQLDSKKASMQALAASELAVIVREHRVRRVHTVDATPTDAAHITGSQSGRSFTESASPPAEQTTAQSDTMTAGRELSATLAATSPAVVASFSTTDVLPPAPASFTFSAFSPLSSPRASALSSPAASEHQWVLDDASAQAFIERLTALLSSSLDNVQYACCLCLSAILSCSLASPAPSPLAPSPPPASSSSLSAFYKQDRDLIVSEGGLRSLLRLLSSPNPMLVEQAGATLLLLCSDMSSAEMLQFVGCQEGEMRAFVRIVEKEVQRLERERRELEKRLDGTRVLMREAQQLCRQQEREGEEDKAAGAAGGAAGVGGVPHSHTKPKMQRKKSRALRGAAEAASNLAANGSPAFSSPCLSPYSSSSSLDDQSVMPTLSIPPLSSSVPGAKSALSASPSTPTFPLSQAQQSSSSSPSLSPRRSHIKKFEYVLSHIDGSGRSLITLTSAASSASAKKKRSEMLSRLSALASSPPSLPQNFREYFLSPLLCSYALRWDGQEGWTTCFLVLTPGELRVYASHAEAPDEAALLIRVRPGDTAAAGLVRAGEYEGLSHAITVEDLGLHSVYTFCFGTEELAAKWKRALEGNGADSSGGGDDLQEEDVANCQALFASLPAVDPAALRPFKAEFPHLRHAGYLLHHQQAQRWTAAFFLLCDATHLYAFESHLSPPSDADFHWELDMTVQPPSHRADAGTVSLSLPALLRLPTVGTVCPLLLCAASSTDRDDWLLAVAAPLSRSSSGSSSSSPSVSAAQLQPFVSFFGHVDHVGFLHRRKRYSSRWTLQLCLLVDTDLLLYDAVTAQPQQHAALYYICTHSGKPFDVVRGADNAAGSLCWELVNPGGNVLLRADTEAEYAGWMAAIARNIARLSEATGARHRKHTQ